MKSNRTKNKIQRIDLELKSKKKMSHRSKYDLYGQIVSRSVFKALKKQVTGGYGWRA